MARVPYRVFVDESGVRAHGPKTSPHFIMSGVILPDARKTDLLAMLAQLRVTLGQPVGHTISFKNLTHQPRLHVLNTIAAQAYLTVTNVIVCKREIPAPIQDVDAAYLLTLRYLLERISWVVDDRGGQAFVTFAHIDYFRIAKLHAYIGLLQTMNTQIRWPAINQPVRMETMQSDELLQVADSTASATGQAFNPNRFGNVDRGYLEVLRPRLYRRVPGPITSYGMKLHPTAMVNDSRYAWVGKL